MLPFANIVTGAIGNTCYTDVYYNNIIFVQSFASDILLIAFATQLMPVHNTSRIRIIKEQIT